MKMKKLSFFKISLIHVGRKFHLIIEAANCSAQRGFKEQFRLLQKEQLSLLRIL